MMLPVFVGSALLTLLSVASVDAIPWRASPLHSRATYSVKDTHNVPRQWSKVSAAPKNHVLNLQIALKQSRFDELEKHLYEVSDPSHARYGQHLTEAEVNDLVKPSDEALNSVQDWLFANDCNSSQLSYSPAKDFISIALSVNEVESLLDTQYLVYQHKDGTQLVRAPEWSLPQHLHQHIETIQPTNSFFRPQARRSHLKTVTSKKGKAASKAVPTYSNSTCNITVAEACDSEAVTSLCLRTLYGTLDYTPQVPGKNKIGLNDFLGETNNRSDISIYLEEQRPDAVAGASQFKFDVINGGNAQQTPLNETQLEDGTGLEGNLDAETIIGIDFPTTLIAFTTGGSPPFKADLNTPTDTNEPYLAWVQHALALSAEDLPQIISTSYGDDEQTVPFAFAKTVCNMFAQLGARGTTVLFSSGDSGVGGDVEDCVSNDGTNKTTFLPSFPDGCPFVTSVGATKNQNPEIVAFDASNDFSSGGGFSNYFPRPPYQEAVVPHYLKTLNNSFSGLFNPLGRGYPDIAAQGYHFVTIWDGEEATLDGTSASCPTASSVLALVNDALLAEGKSPLGFLNPWLYGEGWKAFTDVLSGSAIGCGTDGFPAEKGWDAVTGFGTPFFPSVKAAALKSARSKYGGY